MEKASRSLIDTFTHTFWDAAETCNHKRHMRNLPWNTAEQMGSSNTFNSWDCQETRWASHFSFPSLPFSFHVSLYFIQTLYIDNQLTWGKQRAALGMIWKIKHSLCLFCCQWFYRICLLPPGIYNSKWHDNYCISTRHSHPLLVSSLQIL